MKIQTDLLDSVTQVAKTLLVLTSGDFWRQIGTIMMFILESILAAVICPPEISSTDQDYPIYQSKFKYLTPGFTNCLFLTAITIKR